ncbi:MAG: LysR family transcriptional regulator [Sandaracinaceae bacterium]
MNRVHGLSRIDLNLLVALDALIEERSVTRAAGRIGVTQSAMSHTLRRLRDVFDDPLLVRVGAGMQLTPRAEALSATLRSGLRTLGRVLAAPGFDPATSERTFRIATADLVDALFVPRLLGELRREAPGIALTIVSSGGAGVAEALATGDLDLAVLARPQVEDSAGLVGRTLLRDSLSCYLRFDHPVLEAGLTLAAYVEQAHALISPRGEGPGFVDELLAERGLARRVALRLPHFHSAPAIVAATDLVLTAPSALARLLADDSPLVVRPLPLDAPLHAVACHWHARFTQDPGHVWLRETLARIVAYRSPAAPPPA